MTDHCAGDKPISPYRNFYAWREDIIFGKLTTLRIEKVYNEGIKEYITFSYVPHVYAPEPFEESSPGVAKKPWPYWDYNDWREQRVDDCQSTIEIEKFEVVGDREKITFSYNYIDQLWHHEVGSVLECIEGHFKGWIFLQTSNTLELTVLCSPQNEDCPHVGNMCGYRNLKTDARLAPCKFKKIANRYYPLVVGGYQYPPAVIDRPQVIEDYPWWNYCSKEEYDEWVKKYPDKPVPPWNGTVLKKPKDPLFDPTPSPEKSKKSWRQLLKEMLDVIESKS